MITIPNEPNRYSDQYRHSNDDDCDTSTWIRHINGATVHVRIKIHTVSETRTILFEPPSDCVRVVPPEPNAVPPRLPVHDIPVVPEDVVGEVAIADRAVRKSANEGVV